MMDEPRQRPAQRGYSRELGWHWLLLDDDREVLGLLQPKPEPYHHQGAWELVELDALRAEVERLRAFVEDVAEHGLRCDTNPTVMARTVGEVTHHLYTYIKGVDHSMRVRAARALLEETERRKSKKGAN